MRTGKLSAEELQREVFAHTGSLRKDILVGPAIGQDTAVIDLGGGLCVTSTDPLTGATAHAGYLAINVACNDIYASYAEPVAVLVTLLLPPNAEPGVVGDIMSEASAAAKSLGVAIAGGHTEVTPAVNRVVISCTAIGRVSPSQLVVSNLARPGDSLLLSKTAGVEGTLILLADFAERLGADILALRSGLEAELMAKLSVGTEARLAAANGAHAMHDVTEGGVLGAAVELGTAAGTGVVVYKNAIPLHPVTRIVCEAIEVDAYHLISSGSLMCAVPDEQVQQVLSAWRGAGINGAVIGRITNEPGAFFEDEDGRVAITDPEKDALWDVRS